jgi:hypothetical protein
MPSGSLDGLIVTDAKIQQKPNVDPMQIKTSKNQSRGRESPMAIVR